MMRIKKLIFIMLILILSNFIISSTSAETLESQCNLNISREQIVLSRNTPVARFFISNPTTQSEFLILRIKDQIDGIPLSENINIIAPELIHPRERKEIIIMYKDYQNNERFNTDGIIEVKLGTCEKMGVKVKLESPDIKFNLDQMELLLGSKSKLFGINIFWVLLIFIIGSLYVVLNVYNNISSPFVRLIMFFGVLILLIIIYVKLTGGLS